ncbi:MAG: cryptochrome/photolyase family protein, partial [Pseudanabaenaceae cyanobacterium]
FALPTQTDLGIPDQPQILPPGGEKAAQDLLQDFCASDRLLTYQTARNFPSEAGTSRLSPHLRFGTIGIRRIWAHVTAAGEHLRSDEARQSWQTWQQELCWREFYQHVLLHFPELETGAYRPAMQNFPWDNDPDRFQAWCEGRTGYPIVDAAMQELHHTGWMHNRCRMIVASFLTKNLLVSWQWGEAYFMQQLLDGDLAANNGGWQWSASSGMDPKPLRIFNPYRQAQQFDPDATYIKQWLPALRHATAAEIHSGALLNRRDYPLPIVERRQTEQRFKQRYQACQKAVQ